MWEIRGGKRDGGEWVGGRVVGKSGEVGGVVYGRDIQCGDGGWGVRLMWGAGWLLIWSLVVWVLVVDL